MRPRHGFVDTGSARLFYRDIDRGHPVIVLRDGPDFDHNYLLPELDRLADTFRLIYSDQRGRGRSADGVKPGDVSITSDVDDVNHVRRRFEFESVAVLGHSWGGLLAMEYAVRYPDRVSHLILMNSAPASHRDLVRFREHLTHIRRKADVDRLEELIRSSD